MMRFALVFAVAAFYQTAFAECKKPVVTKLTAESIQKFTDSNPEIDTIDKLLPCLPEELRRNVVISYENLPNEPQEASPRSPRIILFTDDGRFMMAFNGEASQRGYENLEMIEFVDGSKDFRAFSLTLKGDRAARLAYLSSVNNISGHAGVSENGLTPPNPKKCVECHFEDLRPNWQGYSKWPRMIGSNDDQLFLEGLDKEIHISGLEVPKRETEILENFLEDYKERDRYKHLIDIEKSYQLKGPKISSPRTKRTEGEMNAKFTQVLANVNFQRIADRIHSHPEYENIKFSLLGALFCNDNFFGGRSNLDRMDWLSIMVPVFDQVGLDYSSFTMSFLEPGPEPERRFATPAYYRNELAYWLFSEDPEMKPMLNVRKGKRDRVSVWSMTKFNPHDEKVAVLKRWPAMYEAYVKKTGHEDTDDVDVHFYEPLFCKLVREIAEDGIEKLFKPESDQPSLMDGSESGENACRKVDGSIEESVLGGGNSGVLKDFVQFKSKKKLEPPPEFQRCIDCHKGRGSQFHDQDWLERELNHGELLELVKKRMNSIEDPMPPEPPFLREDQKRRIIQYLNAVKKRGSE